MSVRFAVGATLWCWAVMWLAACGFLVTAEGWNVLEVPEPKHYIGAVISVAYLEWCKRLGPKT